jgi:superfamily II DNA helicase RecQ
MSRRWQYADMDAALTESTETLCREICRVYLEKDEEVKRWQALAMQALLEGQDIVVSSGTGSGKSLVYQGMALSRPKAIVLVISPLLSIMEDQVLYHSYY